MANVHYSVSPGRAGINIAVACNITISGGAGAAEFSVAQTGNIGVGCHVVSANVDGFISQMTDSTHATIITATGAAHGDVSVEALTSISHEFSSLALFEAGYTDASHINNASLVAATTNAFAQCYYDDDDDTVDSTSVVFDGVTMSTTYDLTVRTPVGGTESINNQRSTNGQLQASTYRLIITDGNGLDIADNFINFEGIYCKVDNATAARFVFQCSASLVGVSEINFDKCYFDGDANANTYTYVNDADCTVNLTNCIITGCNRSFFGSLRDSASTAINITNCIIQGGYYGVTQASGTVTILNSAIFNNTDDFNGTISCDYCASDDANATTYTNGIDWNSEATDWANNFTNYATNDFSVLDAGADIYNAGTNTGAPSDDIISVSRPQGGTVDIGAFEFVVSGDLSINVADCIRNDEQIGG